MSKLSLSERIALAASGAQDDDYPEDIEYETSAKVVDLDEDDAQLEVRPRRSSLRTKNVKLLDELDPRYAGEKVSRKKVVGESNGLGSGTRMPVKSAKDDIDSLEDDDSLNDVDLSGDEDDDDSDQQLDEAEGSNMDDEDDESGEEEIDASEDDEQEGGESESEIEEDGEDESTGVQTLSLRDKESEIEKGKATLNQIRIWDSLLEVRIRLQKMLIDCNRLPYPDDFDALTAEIGKDEDAGLQKLLKKSQGAASVLIHELLRLQQILIKQNSETKKALQSDTEGKNDATSEDPEDEEITSEEDEDDNADEQSASTSTRKRKIEDSTTLSFNISKKSKPEDFLGVSEKVFTIFKPYRNQTIQKWNDKTQFAFGKFNKKASHHIPTLRQIEQILSNKERLLKRTQIKRSKYVGIGHPETEVQEEQQEQVDPEIFDDDDFYHQLLRELIERKTANVNDPIQLSHHWLELQKLRTKLKKKVDTKASKGRKIRYDVHSKLVNFMAPQDNSVMAAAAVKELFGSLFGKTKE